MGIHDPRLARLTGIPVFLYLFDLLEFDGHDLTGLPLRERKAALRRAFSFHGPVRYTPHRNEHGEEFFARGLREGLGGADRQARRQPLRPRPQRRLAEAEVLVRAGAGDRRLHPAAGLAPALRGAAGRLLRGRRAALRRQSRDRLQRADPGRPRRPGWRRWRSPDSPFARGTGLPREARWVKPQLVGQFAFGEWTRDGKLRHPRYLGLREDKPAARGRARARPGARARRSTVDRVRPPAAGREVPQPSRLQGSAGRQPDLHGHRLTRRSNG